MSQFEIDITHLEITDRTQIRQIQQIWFTLVWHILASWWSSLFHPRTCTRTGIGGTLCWRKLTLFLRLSKIKTHFNLIHQKAIYLVSMLLQSIHTNLFLSCVISSVNLTQKSTETTAQSESKLGSISFEDFEEKIIAEPNYLNSIVKS